MSKEEFLKIQKCVLKVNIHCDGCKHKVKKILQKIDGVYTTEIDAEHGEVTVSGNVDPNVIIKKLAKSGKHAELLAAPKANNSNNQKNQEDLANQLKNMEIDDDNGGVDVNKGENQNENQKCENNQPKGGQQGGPNPQQQQQLQLQQQLQQLQHLQRAKGFQDLKLPNQNPNRKTVKFDIPEEDDEDVTDDELDEMDELPLNRMKPPVGNAARMMLNGNHLLKGGYGGGGNGKKSGGDGPVQVNGMVDGNDGKYGGKKGGGGWGGGRGNNPNLGGGGGEGINPNQSRGGGEGINPNQSRGGGNNQNQGVGNKNNGVKNGGFTSEANNGGGGSKDVYSGGNNSWGKKGNANSIGEGGVQAMDMGGPPAMGNMRSPMGAMTMKQIPAVQGRTAATVNGGGGVGCFQGSGPDVMPGNPIQQQYMPAMMNQHRASMGNDGFHPMMYAPSQPDVNFIYPPSYYPPPDPYTFLFSDENVSGCNIM